MSEKSDKSEDSQNNHKTPAVKVTSELTIRIISALLLGVFTIYLSYYSWESFLALMALTAVLLVWEWGKLTNNDTPLQLLIQGGTICVSLIAFLSDETPLFFASIIGGSLLAVWSTHYWWRSKWALLGLFYVGMPIISFLYLRSDDNYGFYAILFIFLVVWGTDTAAYFTGRHFGGAKLAPVVSPGKTRSGAIGGLFAGLIIGALVAMAIDAQPIILGLIGLFLSAISQVGDLAESAIKRHFGVKDSGNLIPGHGGLFDRLDGVIFAAVAAAIIAYLHPHETPAKALLLWMQ